MIQHSCIKAVNKGGVKISDSKTYMANEQNSSQGLVVLEEFREETKKPMECTTELLMKLLQDNKDTEYGKKYGCADDRRTVTGFCPL